MLAVQALTNATFASAPYEIMSLERARSLTSMVVDLTALQGQSVSVDLVSLAFEVLSNLSNI